MWSFIHDLLPLDEPTPENKENSEPEEKPKLEPEVEDIDDKPVEVPAEAPASVEEIPEVAPESPPELEVIPLTNSHPPEEAATTAGSTSETSDKEQAG